jgi:hypothetical protein
VKLRSSPIRYTTPDHDAITAKSVPLDNTTVSISFISPTVNTTTTIYSKEIKPWFVCEENRLPTLSPPNSGIMAPQPLHARKSSARSKWISNMWTICSDTKLSESIAHKLSLPWIISILVGNIMEMHNITKSTNLQWLHVILFLHW